MSVVSGVIPWLWLYRRIGAIFLSFSGKRETRTKHESRTRGEDESNNMRLFELGYFPASEAEKIDFSFIWINWIKEFNLTFPYTNFLKSLKALELFRRTYFQIKVIKSGRCHDLGPGRISKENFRGNRSCWDSFFMLFPYFIYVAHTTKFTRGTLCFWKNLQGKSKAEESPRSRKKKVHWRKKERKKEYHSVQKRKKIPFWKRLVDHEEALIE